MKIKFILLLMMSLLSGCAVIKGMHEDALEAKAHPKEASSTLPQAQQAKQNGTTSQQAPTSRNASEAAGRLISPIVQ